VELHANQETIRRTGLTGFRFVVYSHSSVRKDRAGELFDSAEDLCFSDFFYSHLKLIIILLLIK